VPVEGDVLEVSGFRLRVLTVGQRRVGHVGIEKLADP